MVYNYIPSYYSSSFHDTLASLCKSLLLPFSSSHKRRHRQLPSDDHINNKFAKRQTDNLKWPQDSFHRILNLIGLHKEGLLPEADVSAFRSHLLDTLLATSPKDQPEPEPAALTRDRLLFLQELLYAECISADQYRSSESPLLHRLALQEEEDWSVIELGERESPPPVPKTKQQTPAKSLFKWKGKAKAKKDPYSTTTDAGNGGGGSILMPESSPGVNKPPEKRKPFRALMFNDNKSESSPQKPTKKHWGLDGLKKWRRGDDVKEDESTAPYLLAGDSSEDASTVVPCHGLAEGENMKKEELNEPLVVDVAKKELKDHSNAYNGDPGGWVAFEENEENFHPNLFFRDQSASNQGMGEANCNVLQSKDARDCFLNNPFVDDQNHLWATKKT